MKYLYLFALYLLISCKPSSNFSSKEVSLSSINSYCPEDGKCTLILEKNKSIILKKDDIGKLYYELQDDNSKSVIKYKYSKNIQEDLQDANYQEEIIFEINNDITQIQLSNDDLRNLKMIYGRHCYCKGQAGYYNVNKGKLLLIKKNEKLEFSLDFLIDEVPQIISNIQNKSPN